MAVNPAPPPRPGPASDDRSGCEPVSGGWQRIQLDVLPSVVATNSGWGAQVVVPMTFTSGDGTQTADVLYDIGCLGEDCRVIRIEREAQPSVRFFTQAFLEAEVVAHDIVDDVPLQRDVVVFRWRNLDDERNPNWAGELRFNRTTGRVTVTESSDHRSGQGAVDIAPFPPPQPPPRRLTTPRHDG